MAASHHHHVRRRVILQHYWLLQSSSINCSKPFLSAFELMCLHLRRGWLSHIVISGASLVIFPNVLAQGPRQLRASDLHIQGEMSAGVLVDVACDSVMDPMMWRSSVNVGPRQPLVPVECHGARDFISASLTDTCLHITVLVLPRLHTCTTCALIESSRLYFCPERNICTLV